MDLMGSFNSTKVNTFNFFYVRGLMGDNELLFLFDTGAACPVVGINCLFDADEEKKAILEQVIRDEIEAQNVDARPIPLKAANSQEVTTYPCVCHNVSIGGTIDADFYFDIAFDDISIPLLGSSYIDDCSYNHAINGNIVITGTKEDVGKSFYMGYKVLDFGVVVKEYDNMISMR